MADYTAWDPNPAVADRRYARTKYASAVFEPAAVAKPLPGILYGLNAYNKNASARYIQVFDAASIPAAGSVPEIEVAAATASSANPVIPAVGIPFVNGITVCASTTSGNLTLAGTDCVFEIVYA